jgi:hypothetical protein
MKIYGHKKDEGLAPEAVKPDELAEITLVATCEELRKIVRFMDSVADRIEKGDRGFTHEHLADKQPGFENSPHFVVWRSDAS